MSADVTPIRPDVKVPAPKGPRRSPRGSGPRVPVKAMDEALLDQRIALFQAMGIVRLASATLRNSAIGADEWTALDGAHAILSTVADRLECTETMLADDVPRGNY
jgi:hypothetical protein